MTIHQLTEGSQIRVTDVYSKRQSNWITLRRTDLNPGGLTATEVAEDGSRTFYFPRDELNTNQYHLVTFEFRDKPDENIAGKNTRVTIEIELPFTNRNTIEEKLKEMGRTAGFTVLDWHDHHEVDVSISSDEGLERLRKLLTGN